MTCEQCLSMADAFLADELPVDTSQGLIAHLEGCATCRAELEARRGLREGLRLAFRRSPELAPPASFAADLRARLRPEPAQARGPRWRPWHGLAAAAVVAGATVLYALWSLADRTASVDWARLAGAAAGDHRYCALEHALEEPPISLEEAAQRYEPAYRRLREVVEGTAPVRAGEAVVVGAHACVFERRRFAHVVVQHAGRVLSVLVTSGDGAPVKATPIVSCGRSGGFETACGRAGRYLVFAVSDLSPAANLALATGVLPPVQDHVAGGQSSARRDARDDAVRMAVALYVASSATSH